MACSNVRPQGVNAVWIHTVLRDLAPSEQFPEFGAGHETRLANLRKLVERGKRHGISVILYLNEPRAMPASFFVSRPDLAGVREGDYVAMCTSSPVVLRWISAALTHVFQQVPDLGAFSHHGLGESHQLREPPTAGRLPALFETNRRRDHCRGTTTQSSRA
jgi:hypothetical protein